MKQTQDRYFRIAVSVAIVLVACGVGAIALKKGKDVVEADGGKAPQRQSQIQLANLKADGEIPTNTTAWNEIDDASGDGWRSEVLAEQVSKRLQEIGAATFSGKSLPKADIERLCSRSFTGSSLLPKTIRTSYDDGVISIDRWSHENDAASLTQDLKGVQGLQLLLEDLARPWRNVTQSSFKFKVIHVSQHESELRTQQIVSSQGKVSDGSIEQHATWDAIWELNSEGDVDRLRSIAVVDFEQTTCKSTQKLFSDVTASALQSNSCYKDQFLFGMNHWLDRNQDMRYFSPLGNPGLAIGDVNGDGLDDLYVCQESNLPNRLFLQQADGTAIDVSAKWKVDWLESSRSALFVDLDNDGDQDLAVAILGGILIASNEGEQFAVRDVLATDDDTTSLTAVDYDLDGRLDLYVCVDYPNDTISSERTTQVQVGAGSRVYHDANTAGRNSLFRNEHSSKSAWKFSDVTRESGLSANNQRFTWAASWDDYDNDGDQDLYVANDFGRNNLYRNDNGFFNDVAGATKAEDSASGMSTAWADVNRDGNMDVYISNMFSSAGSRITHQPDFKRDAAKEIRSRLQRFARGSTLLQNSDSGVFKDVSVDSAVSLGRWAWGSNFLDVNNDGWQDIAVANGYITADDNGDL